MTAGGGQTNNTATSVSLLYLPNLQLIILFEYLIRLKPSPLFGGGFFLCFLITVALHVHRALQPQLTPWQLGSSSFIGVIVLVPKLLCLVLLLLGIFSDEDLAMGCALIQSSYGVPTDQEPLSPFQRFPVAPT